GDVVGGDREGGRSVAPGIDVGRGDVDVAGAAQAEAPVDDDRLRVVARGEQDRVPGRRGVDGVLDGGPRPWAHRNDGGADGGSGEEGERRQDDTRRHLWTLLRRLDPRPLTAVSTKMKPTDRRRAAPGPLETWRPRRAHRPRPRRTDGSRDGHSSPVARLPGP